MSTLVVTALSGWRKQGESALLLKIAEHAPLTLLRCEWSKLYFSLVLIDLGWPLVLLDDCNHQLVDLLGIHSFWLGFLQGFGPS